MLVFKQSPVILQDLGRSFRFGDFAHKFPNLSTNPVFTKVLDIEKNKKEKNVMHQVGIGGEGRHLGID